MYYCAVEDITVHKKCTMIWLTPTTTKVLLSICYRTKTAQGPVWSFKALLEETF